MKKIAFILLAGTMVLLNSCTKTGPQGPQGIQGPQGPQGNANVKGSDPFDVRAVTWVWNTSENAWMVSFTDPDVTNAVADHGIVELFLLYSDGTWRNLPDILYGGQFYSRFSAGGFDIYFASTDGSAIGQPTVTYTFRSVVISPSNKKAHPNTNWNNYDEAMAALNNTAVAASAQ
jgi:hypothetical protein